MKRRRRKTFTIKTDSYISAPGSYWLDWFAANEDLDPVQEVSIMLGVPYAQAAKACNGDPDDDFDEYARILDFRI